MRKIALFSDVHGNLAALDAVLDDIRSRGLDEAYCLGDLVGYGPDPAGVVERVRSLGIPTIRGNYDDGIGNRRGQCGCYYATAQARIDGEASYAFTERLLSDSNHDWLAALPGEIRFEHKGVRVLLAHGSPRKINEYLLPDRKDSQLARLAQQAGADIVCIGHVHVPYHRTVSGTDGAIIHYVSSGSAGKPKDGDPRAGWVELVLGRPEEIESCAAQDASAGRAGTTDIWVGAVVHRVEYDIEGTTLAMRVAGLPETLAEALRHG